MKALEILRDNYISIVSDMDKEMALYRQDHIQIVIRELEDLENRNCSNCKYNKEQDNFMIFCDCVMCEDGSKMMWHSFTKHFGCNKWENKHKITNI